MTGIVKIYGDAKVGKDTNEIFCPVLKSLSKNGSYLLIATLFVFGTLLGVIKGISVKQVMSNYSYDVLVILIVMELFTNLIAETGIMQLLAIKIAALSKGRKRICLALFGALMFLISSCLNNITAVMIILPIVFVLLKTLEVDKKYICVFFATLLALSNTGGAASPVGDFPAIVIMTSGITTFLSYLTHAFPLFLITSLALIFIWTRIVKKENDDDGIRILTIMNLKSRYKHIGIRFDVLKWLIFIFFGMFIAWSIIPQEIIPPEIIAILGYVISMVISSIKRIKVNQKIDLKSVLTIASFLFFAEIVSETGILKVLASYMQDNINDPKLLVMLIMVITSLVSGLFSAGPAAAAMMPVIIQICQGPLSQQSDWIAVAYAASICAGSSLFMWSATAGFILSGNVNDARITDYNEKQLNWGVSQYMKYGVINYLIQISIALIAIWIIL
ncbi:MAG: citrate transporter [Lachnospiraceae bacterium]|nr:citrate transporter [Lachnospiraceae bacterium]